MRVQEQRLDLGANALKSQTGLRKGYQAEPVALRSSVVHLIQLRNTGFRDVTDIGALVAGADGSGPVG
jgi:hypothetical protein